MIFKMALKNLFANKSKSIITLSLIGIGTFLIVLGLGVLNFGLQQTRDVCISDFSGDLLITGVPEKKDIQVGLLSIGSTVSLGIREDVKMPYIGSFRKVTTKLSSMHSIKAFTPSVVSTANMLRPANLEDNWQAKSENRSYYPFVKLLGVEAQSYPKVFDTIHLTKGQFPLTNDSHFFLMPMDIKENFEKYYERKINIGDEIIIQGFGTSGKMQKVRITGFFNFAHSNTAIDGIAYSDVSLCRQIAGMTMGARTATEIPDSVDLSLTEKSEDELFSDDDFFADTTEVADSGMSITEVQNILGSTELRDSLNMPDSDAWNHIALRLQNPSKTGTVKTELNDFFQAEGLPLQALEWDQAMYPFVDAIGMGKQVLVFALILLSVVVLIVIMNTLVVSIMERTAEIGTMRAIGAKKNFVRKIFYMETFVMTFAGVIMGIIFAFIFASIFNSLDIRLNEIMAVLFGGYYVRVSISALSLISTTVAMLLAGFFANLYPVRIALKISPLEAINR